MEEIRLTQFSKGAGCGCKIAPDVLEKILHSTKSFISDKKLIVGNESKDDAAVYDMGNDTYLISTTDFFTPIVDDPQTFGKIAAANALSDVYAMGGTPLLAIAVLGWPVERLPVETAALIIDAAREICAEAGIVLAGGHSIDSPEPFFGLSVNGIVKPEHLKKNNTAEAGNLLCLTKPLGVGILATAEKRKLLKPEHAQAAPSYMTRLNTIGTVLGTLEYVTAMTDVTGFSLVGHLAEMAEGSNISAKINYKNVPVIPEVKEYAVQFIYPDNTMRNWNSYQQKVEGIEGESLLILCDPQTNGGLLFTVRPQYKTEIQKLFAEQGEEVFFIGEMTEKKEKVIYIE